MNTKGSKANNVNPSTSEVKSFHKHITCHHCGKIGHIRPFCLLLYKCSSTCLHCGTQGHIRPYYPKLRKYDRNVLMPHTNKFNCDHRVVSNVPLRHGQRKGMREVKVVSKSQIVNSKVKIHSI